MSGRRVSDSVWRRSWTAVKRHGDHGRAREGSNAHIQELRGSREKRERRQGFEENQESLVCLGAQCTV